MSAPFRGRGNFRGGGGDRGGGGFSRGGDRGGGGFSRGGDRGGGGFSRGGDRGGRGSSRGGRGGRGGFQQSFGPPDTVVELGTFEHAVEGQMFCNLIDATKIPMFNGFVFLENKNQIGRIEEILGPLNKVCFTVKPQNGILATSFQRGDKFYISPDKLLPVEKFLPKPKQNSKTSRVKKPKGERGGARGGRGGPRGRGGFSVRGGSRGRGAGGFTPNRGGRGGGRGGDRGGDRGGGRGGSRGGRGFSGAGRR